MRLIPYLFTFHLPVCLYSGKSVGFYILEEVNDIKIIHNICTIVLSFKGGFLLCSFIGYEKLRTGIHERFARF